MLIAFIATLYFLYPFYKNIGTIFNYTDEIGSYNYWAVQWTKNSFPNPIDTMGYPIATSANWSLTYLLQNNSSVQFFNKMLMSFFPISAALLLWDLAIRFSNFIPLLALCIFSILTRIFTPYYIGEGPHDLIAACCAYFSFYAAIVATNDKSINIKKILTVHLFAACCAVIKQSGLLVVMATILWMLYLLWENKQSLSRKKIFQITLFTILITLTFTLSWYLWIQYLIYEGRAASEATYLMKGIHAGRTYPERFLKAISMFLGEGTIYDGKIFVKIFITTLVIFSLFSLNKISTVFLWILQALFFILWAFFFSYEHRTLALVFPFLAYTSASGIAIILKYWNPSLLTIPAAAFKKKIIPLSQKFIFIFLVSAVALVVSLQNSVYNDKKLLDRQYSLQINSGDKELNEKLYRYYKTNAIDGKIASIYGILKFLPEINKYYFQLRAPATKDLIKNLEEREDIYYLLVSTNSKPLGYGFSLTEADAIDMINANLNTNKYQLIFKHKNYSFIKIR